MAQETSLLTATEVAKTFRTSTETVRRWTREGRLQAVTLPSGHRRYRREDIEALLRGAA